MQSRAISMPRIILLLVLLLAGTGTACAETAVRRFEQVTPRAFGYVIGDTFSHHLYLELNAPFRLLTEALPKPGRVTHWLELRPPTVTTRRLQRTVLAYEIVLTYQLINIEPGQQQYLTPSLALAYSDGQGRFTLPVTARPFTASTLSDPQRRTIQPDRPPPPLTPAWLALGFSAALGCSALLGLAYIHLTLPWLSRHQRPFARAERALAQLPPVWDAAQTQTALRLLHQALNETHGTTLFAADLERFLDRQPGFAHLREPLAELLRQSRAVFFLADPTAAPTAADLRRLCRQCRDAERGLR